MYVGLALLACSCLGANGRRVQSSFTPAQVPAVIQPISSHPLASGKRRHVGNLVSMQIVGDDASESFEAKPLGANQTMQVAEQLELSELPKKKRSDASSSSNWRWGGSAQMLGAACAANFLSRVALASRRRSVVQANAETEKTNFFSVDFVLLLCVTLWYLGNYYCNITTKLAHKAAGGAAGFPLIIATLQLGVGVLYALFLWAAPDARKFPSITFKEYLMTLPVGAMAAYAHAGTHFALSAGSISFSQIIKTAEPFFVAFIGTVLYGARVSLAKWLCLIPVIGGVGLATLGELHFSLSALLGASCANLFSAFKANENKKLMTTPGISESLRSVNNQFAIIMINAFLFCLPVTVLFEGHKIGTFLEVCRTTPAVPNNIIISGLWFYMYSELSTIVIKKTNAITQSVLNTAKRVIVIIVVAVLLHEGLSPIKLIGCCIGIFGVFLYSIIDRILASNESR